jgi:hypothetical protein
MFSVFNMFKAFNLFNSVSKQYALDKAAELRYKEVGIMAIHLIEHQVGFDTGTTGFPGLGSCMAVALLTSRGIYGFHFTPAPIAQAAAFAHYIAARRLPGEHDLRLYGSCYWDNRYQGGAKAQWKAEMTAIAGAINFHGRVNGFDTSAWIAHTDPHDTTYLEYRAVGGKCKIFYKKTVKMDIIKPVQAANPLIQRIKPNVHLPGAYVLSNPTETKNILTTSVLPTRANKGEMHEAGMIGKHSFDIP